MNITPQNTTGMESRLDEAEHDIKVILHAFLMEYVGEKDDVKRDEAIETATNAITTLVEQARGEGREEAVSYIEQYAGPEWDSPITDDDKVLEGYSVSLEVLNAARTISSDSKNV